MTRGSDQKMDQLGTAYERRTLGGPRKLGRMLLGTLFLVAAGVGVSQATVGLVSWARSGGWVQVQAQVVESAVDNTTWESRNTKGSVVRSETRYRPRVRYTYWVNGNEYEAERRKFGEESSGSGQNKDDWMSFMEPAAEIVARYPTGATINVFVDPADPTQAVIERDIDFSTWRALSLSLLIGFIGLRLVTAGALREGAAEHAKWWMFRRSPCWWDVLIIVGLFAIVWVVRTMDHSI
ncbi:MAG TPA: DUF3592 domain-containing protein [Pirellulaceae bacterium]|nr:DUF3592 domain-containing protein [Pirellulaceae bacterium]HMO93148.1 DUF3592 domain-containing protein [Pirellulaceae bacterium]HMP70022.1 DUF3592 domain-containing protein [Pirellulaceae bacterium]